MEYRRATPHPYKAGLLVREPSAWEAVPAPPAVHLSAELKLGHLGQHPQELLPESSTFHILEQRSNEHLCVPDLFSHPCTLKS